MKNTRLQKLHPGKLVRAMKMIWQTDRLMATGSILIQVIQAAMPVLSLYLVKLLIEALVNRNDRSHIFVLLGAFAGSQLVLAVAGQLGVYLQAIHQQKLADHFTGKVLEKAVAVDFGYYENPAYHNTLHLAQQQSLYRIPQLLNTLTQMLQSGFSILFLLALFAGLKSSFACWFIILCLPLALIKWYYGFAFQKQERAFVPLERESNYLIQTLTGTTYAKEARVFGFGSSFIDKFWTIRRYIHDQKKTLQLKLAVYSLIAEGIEILAITFVFYFLARQSVDGLITIGVFVMYIQGFQRMQSTAKNFLQSLVQVFQLKVFLNDLFAFFDIPPKPSIKGGSHRFPGIKDEGLIVKEVSFTYPGTGKQVLHQVSLNCKPASLVAIVGENGSGKSTLVKLLAGLYTAEQGSITIEGTALQSIDEKGYRDNSIFLFQDFEKFFFTIGENITLASTGKPADPGKMERAAALSGAGAFIKKLSKGYETRLGRLFEGSEQLSGGEWQKLALSRVFYKQAELIILDEPTSALDANIELELFKNITEHLQDKMVILITHRLYNLKLAGHIYVMEEGRIAEEGNFNSLVNRNGIFRKMYEAQKL